MFPLDRRRSAAGRGCCRTPANLGSQTLQAGGRRFETCRAHHHTLTCRSLPRSQQPSCPHWPVHRPASGASDGCRAARIEQSGARANSAEGPRHWARTPGPGRSPRGRPAGADPPGRHAEHRRRGGGPAARISAYPVSCRKGSAPYDGRVERWPGPDRSPTSTNGSASGHQRARTLSARPAGVCGQSVRVARCGCRAAGRAVLFCRFLAVRPSVLGEPSPLAARRGGVGARVSSCHRKSTINRQDRGRDGAADRRLSI
jgi:hypothetical protein